MNTDEALAVVSGLVLDDGETWAAKATETQLADLRAWLADPAPYHFTTRARGYAKTQDAAAASIGLLVTAPGDWRGYVLASDRDQGRLALESIEGFARRTESLAGALDIQTSQVVAPSGARLVVLPADAPGTWGLRPDWAIADELSQWADTPAARKLWEALTTALPKRPGSRLAVITTAGSPRHWSHDVLEHARESDLWRVSETPGPPPWADQERLAEQRARLPEAVYRQLFENEWTEPVGDFLDPDAIDRAIRREGPNMHPTTAGYVAALDLGAVNDRTVFCIGHREEGRTILDLMETWQGSRSAPVNFAAVGEAVLDLCRRFKVDRLVLDPWQGLEMAGRLKAEGVKVREFHFSPQSKMRLASSLLHALNTDALDLYEANGLRDELVALRVTQTGTGMFAFDHAAGEHDDRAVALSMMLVELTDRASRPRIPEEVHEAIAEINRSLVSPSHWRTEPSGGGGNVVAPFSTRFLTDA